jgi:glycogen synthase
MTADTVGGVWSYAMDLARGLSGRGVEVFVATMGAAMTREQRWQAASIPNLEIHESQYKLEWMDDPWCDVERAGDWLLRLESDLDVDIVHLNGYAHGSLPWRAPHVVVGHSCVLSWWRAVKGEAAPAEWTRYRTAVRAGLQAAASVIAPTRAMLAELQRFYGPLGSTTVIANGRKAEGYGPGKKEPFILAAGRLWDEAKNISALGHVRRAVEWPIRVAGEARHPNGELVNPGSIQLLGVLTPEQLRDQFARAAIYCLPARYEPFGLSILEAAMSGCALVIGDIPSLRENWEGAAVFVPPDDTYALEVAIRSLTGSEEYAAVMGKRAIARATRFGLERMCDSYLALYYSLLERRPMLAATGD